MRLGWWKARVWGRHAFDRSGGSALLAWRGASWARAWSREYGAGPDGLARWLERAGGGEFWISPAGAKEWAHRTCTPLDLELADRAVAGCFDLLGSGPIELGGIPRWRTDLYSGIEWPLLASSRLPIVRGDGSDIRTVWELSRGYHLLALGRAYWTTGREEYLTTLQSHLISWIEQNPLGRGPHWASPMDVAIRAANWTLALVLCARAELASASVWGAVLGNLYASGLFLERHLEWHPRYRGNHFVSNGVGLVYLGVLFRDTAAGKRWLARGARILREEILFQVGRDGVSFESSLAYHRLDTEFFGFAGELVERNAPGELPPSYWERVRRMYAFIDAYLPASGEAPMLGDADDGRLHAWSAEGFLHPRRHRLGLPEGYWPERPARSEAFPEGGFYIVRQGSSHAVIRCGAVGLHGAGSHDHNDQLALELVLGGRRVLADSGTYAYTRDLAARHAFRSTAAHGVVQLGDEEQNPIIAERPWRVVADRTRAECIDWSPEGERPHFEGRHHGYAHRGSGAVCYRRVVLHADSCTLIDRVRGSGDECVLWRLHFGRGTLIPLQQRSEGELLFRLAPAPLIHLRVRAPRGMHVQLGEVEGSDRYGVRHLRPSLTLWGVVRLPFLIETVFQLEES